VRIGLGIVEEHDYPSAVSERAKEPSYTSITNVLRSFRITKQLTYNDELGSTGAHNSHTNNALVLIGKEYPQLEDTRARMCGWTDTSWQSNRAPVPMRCIGFKRSHREQYRMVHRHRIVISRGISGGKNWGEI